MANVYFYGDAVPIQSYLQVRLVVQGHTVVSTLDEAQVVVVQPWSGEIENPLKADEGEDTLLGFFQTLAQEQRILRRLIFLSSAEVYGEGYYLCGDCGLIEDAVRPQEQMGAYRWEMLCPICREMMVPVPARETMPLKSETPRAQRYRAYEQACEMLGREVSWPVNVFRLFSPYWPELSYLEWQNAGVVGGITRDLLSGKSPIIYEEGYQMRDLVYGEDIAQALDRLIQATNVGSGVYNLGSGEQITILDLVAYLQEFLGRIDVPYTLLEQYRPGDIRHRLADIGKARRDFGYDPAYGVVSGLSDFAKHVLVLRTVAGEKRS